MVWERHPGNPKQTEEFGELGLLEEPLRIAVVLLGNENIYFNNSFC